MEKKLIDKLKEGLTQPTRAEQMRQTAELLASLRISTQGQSPSTHLENVDLINVPVPLLPATDSARKEQLRKLQ